MWCVETKSTLNGSPYELCEVTFKEECWIVSSWWQNTHFVSPCQLRLARLSLVRTTSFLSYHRKILTFSGNFSFHTILSRTTLPLLIKAVYIDRTEKTLFWCSPQRKVSLASVSVTWATGRTSWCHKVIFRPTSPRRKEMFNGTELKTDAIEAFFLLTIR
jgi:hypothetical protein